MDVILREIIEDIVGMKNRGMGLWNSKQKRMRTTRSR